MRRVLAFGAAVAALALAALPAKADTFNYTSFSVNPGNSVTLTDPTLLANPLTVSAGEITLNGSGTFMGQPISSIDAWCLDILTSLTTAGSYNIVPFTGPGSFGNGNPSVSTLQVQEIASMMLALGGALDNNPLATQLAIWRLEYGPGLTFSSNDITVDNDILLSATLATDASLGGSLFNSNAQLALLDVVPTDQVLGTPFAATPIGSTIWLMAGGLVLFGMFAWRRKNNQQSLVDGCVA
jgi:hypothetical protein